MEGGYPGEPAAGPPPELEPSPERERRPRPRPEPRRAVRRRLAWLAVGAVLVAGAFLLGLVVGRALEDAPKPGGEQTLVRTLVPSTLGPADVVTVTVTVTGS